MLALLVMAASAGLVIVAGCLVLLYQQKIFIDRETNQIIEVVTPVVRFKTHVPVLVLFGLGAALIGGPIYWAWQNPRMEIVGDIESVGSAPTRGVAVVDEKTVGGKPGTEHFSLSVPSLGEPYTVLYLSGGVLVDSKEAKKLGRGSHGPTIMETERVAGRPQYVTAE